ncbi:hypothetical protein [Roseateles sp. LYH14W]|uniref:Uncharacterized protein n=1 Tax=Pelomonas parva TaxID=3299032 RepID=A0ABW7F3Z5_9BURK
MKESNEQAFPRRRDLSGLNRVEEWSCTKEQDLEIGIACSLLDKQIPELAHASQKNFVLCQFSLRIAVA